MISTLWTLFRVLQIGLLTVIGALVRAAVDIVVLGWGIARRIVWVLFVVLVVQLAELQERLKRGM